MEPVIIYTDGGCDPNPGFGAWAAILIEGKLKKEISGNEPDSTNNRMELTAAIEALKCVSEGSNAMVFTDSQYVKRGIEEWMPRWLEKNWKGSNGKIANRDLWEALVAECDQRQVAWRWVKGHGRDVNNIRVDWLVRKEFARAFREK